MKQLVYLDYAAATPLDRRVFLAMQPYFVSSFGNPAALYKLGVAAKSAVEQSRQTIADILKTTSDTILFTSGGTESNNHAIFGVINAYRKKTRPHIIITAVEHEAVIKPAQAAESLGVDLTVLPVDKNGLVNADQVIGAIRPNTCLISVMYANNEIGSIEPIASIGRALLKWRRDNKTSYPYFHTDACQAAGYEDLSVDKLHIDLLTLNGSKIYGPKGSAVLYVRRGVKISPLIYGGSQENGARGGTENVPAIVGLAEALKISFARKSQENIRLRKLSLNFFKKLKQFFPAVSLNGPEIGGSRLANNINVVIPGLDAETALLYLDAKGVMCSTGSACTAINSTPSHVLAAIGLNPAAINSSFRFTLGRQTTQNQLNYTAKTLKQIAQLLLQ